MICDLSGTDHCVSVSADDRRRSCPDRRNLDFGSGRKLTMQDGNETIDELEKRCQNNEDLAEMLSAERSLLRRSTLAAARYTPTLVCRAACWVM